MNARTDKVAAKTLRDFAKRLEGIVVAETREDPAPDEWTRARRSAFFAAARLARRNADEIDGGAG